MDSLEKVLNKEWTEKAQEVLHVTGTIIEDLGKSGVPLIDMLELALKLGSNVLDPIPKMSELEKEREVIEKIIEDAEDGSITKTLTIQLQAIRDEMDNAMAKHYKTLQRDIQTTFKHLSEDIENIEDNLFEMKDIVHRTFEGVLDQHFENCIDLVESTYKEFMKCIHFHNIQSMISRLENLLFQLQTMENLSESKVEQYLRTLVKVQGCDTAKVAFNYISVLKTKRLQLTTVFFIYKNDLISVVDEFEYYNNEFVQLEKMYMQIFGEKFNPLHCPIIATSFMEKSVEANKNALDGDLQLNDDTTTTNKITTRRDLHMAEMGILGNFVFTFPTYWAYH